MPSIRGLTVSVGYGDLLAVTLVRNMRHFSECVVVTSPEDVRTQEVARSVPGVRLSITDAFTRWGARFNKGLAIEEAGFDFMGRHGWVCLHDADILLPDNIPLATLRPDRLHGAWRRILEDPTVWRPDLPWLSCPARRDGGPIGFFQLFHADAPSLAGKRPWYDVSFAHAGGGDAFFMERFPREARVVLPLEVLHLGPADMNWFGTDGESRDLMAKFVTINGWQRAMGRHSPEAVARAGEPVHRVKVPGYPPSGYELPFVKRAQANRPTG